MGHYRKTKRALLAAVAVFSMMLSFAASATFGDGIALVTAAIAETSKSAAVFLMQGIFHYDQNQLAEAIQEYSNAIELDPEYACVYYERGTACADLGQYENAISDLSKAIELKWDPPARTMHAERFMKN